MIGVLLAFAITVSQLWYGVIPSELSAKAFASIAWPYAILIVFLVVASTIRAPIALDSRRAARIESLRKSARKRNISPKAPRLDHVKNLLSEFDDKERSFIKWLLNQGETHYPNLDRSGIPGEIFRPLLVKGRRSGLIQEREAHGGERHGMYYKINPIFEEALFLILAD